MSPIFYEDSLGAKLAEKAAQATDRAREAELAYIDDPEALERAEQEVHNLDVTPDYSAVGDDWVVVFGPSKVSSVIDVAGPTAMLIAMPLDAEGIAYCWDPYPPQDMPGAATPAEHAADRPFSILVAPENAERARELLAGTREGSTGVTGVAATHERTPEALRARRVLSGSSLVLLYGAIAVAMVISIVLWLVERLQ